MAILQSILERCCANEHMYPNFAIKLVAVATSLKKLEK